MIHNNLHNDHDLLLNCNDDDDKVVVLGDEEEQQFLSDLGEDIGPPLHTSPSQEELFDSLLPPLNHIVIPNTTGRRRAHTVDAHTDPQRRVSDSIIHHNHLHHHHNDTDADDDDDLSLGYDDDSSLEVDLFEDHEDRRMPSTPLTDRVVPRRAPPQFTISQDSRQRRRQKLVNSRCMRGFVLLCVYGVLVLQPSLNDATPSAALSLEPLDAPTVLSNSTAQSLAARRSSSASTLLPMPNLPKLQLHPQQQQQLRPVFRGVSIPNATTTTAGGGLRHRVPPTPPHVYHKKQRPILSHAHSYQLHQEPLVFGRELKTSFVEMDSSDNDEHGRHRPSAEGIVLIWLSLVCLLGDTIFREWQHFRWHRQYSSTRRSSAEGANRSRHDRRSPSPMPRNATSNNRRVVRQHQQRRRPPRPRFDSF